MTAHPPPHPADSAHPPTEVRRAWRVLDGAVLGGVAGGLAVHLGLPVLWTRIAFIALTLTGGAGVALYAVLWVVLPVHPGPVHGATGATSAPGLAAATRLGKRPGHPERARTDVALTVILAVLGFGGLLGLMAAFGITARVWPLVLGGIGVMLLWRQADERQRLLGLGAADDTASGAAPGRFGGRIPDVLRVGAALGLLALAVSLIAWRSESWGSAREVLGAGLLGVVAVALIAAPWGVRLVTELTRERAERVRSQERADLAAHLHDSVLQTLALIQRNAADPAAVSRLARTQERELRSWLFTEERRGAETVGAAMRAAAARVEENWPVAVEVVAVADAPMTPDLDPLVQATSEALTNAARHAGVAAVDLYVETTAEAVEVFVRDRGVGFDPDRVAPARHGVRHSIRGRMERHHGTARIRSAPGEGTEVRLRMPRQKEER